MTNRMLMARIDRHAEEIRSASDRAALTAVLETIFFDDLGHRDGLVCAELLAGEAGRGGGAEQALYEAVRRHRSDDVDLVEAVRELHKSLTGHGVTLTGAECVAFLLGEHNVDVAFAYPGTSEIALCDAVARSAGTRLVNGRGDKECAFMAAGASLLRPNRGVAILHAARGLTNAAGGVADARRTEVGTLFLVGLPSTGSARFLPPHGEHDLLPAIGTFADWWWQAPAVPEDEGQRAGTARTFVRKLREALTASARMPCRPAMFGIPQDVAERRWIPLSALLTHTEPACAIQPGDEGLHEAAEIVRAAQRAVLLIDDYALRYDGARDALDRLATVLGAPVLQLRYRRGPMLFERLQRSEVANFAGWLNQFSPAHADLLKACDLLVTVEDRNMYSRVIGELPQCRKIAINGDMSKALKNEYLSSQDRMLEGDITVLMRRLASVLESDHGERDTWFPLSAIEESLITPEPADSIVEHMRTCIVESVAEILRRWDAPVLIDDSQMFGGLVSERYDLLPTGLRVFGGHGGFVGGGLASATGLATAYPGRRVLCTLGDQAFTNSFQGLVAAVQEQALVRYLVCNNSESVSLQKQARASYAANGSARRAYLENAPRLSYRDVAAALGVPSFNADFTDLTGRRVVDDAARKLSTVLAEADGVSGPALVELRMPADPDAWLGIWITEGFEKTASVEVMS